MDLTSPVELLLSILIHLPCVAFYHHQMFGGRILHQDNSIIKCIENIGQSYQYCNHLFWSWEIFGIFQILVGLICTKIWAKQISRSFPRSPKLLLFPFASCYIPIINSFPPRQDGTRYFQIHFCELKALYFDKISLKCVPKVPIDNKQQAII